MAIETKAQSEDFSTTAQLFVDDLAQAAALGFKSIINNRPDNEGGPEQPLNQTLKAEAEKLGLSYFYIPVIPNNIQPNEVDTFKKILNDAPKPVLGFCRTGNRAGKMFALSQT